jgi:acetoin utilization deacetylase AcuC-like enzyme
MQFTLFEKAPAEIRSQVHHFIDETQQLLVADQFQSEDIIARRHQIQEYLENPKYSGLPDRLKRALRKLDKEMSPVSPMDTEAEIMEIDPIQHHTTIQLPADDDLIQMRGMPAGAKEDQALRLTNMVQAVRTHSKSTLLDTDKAHLSHAWKQLFISIDQRKKIEAVKLIRHMAETDSLLKAILRVHPLRYLEQLISYCIEAHAHGLKKLNSDVILTPKTFEVLIKDLATTMHYAEGVYFSFGLPSHHAYSTMGSGFCILNKVAILLQDAALKYEIPPKFIIIGTDVNRDNGLCAVLQESATHLDIQHIDVFDSHVYPNQDHEIISEEFGTKGEQLATGIQHWSQEQFNYFAVDLHDCVRKKNAIHPALLFALNKLEESIYQAQRTQQKIMLYLPTGWDSHQDETAFCGKCVRGAMMSDAAAKIHRFDNQDLSYFYQKIITLYQKNHECFAGIYWGLEGGYDQSMYLKQISLMLNTVESLLSSSEPSISPLKR